MVETERPPFGEAIGSGADGVVGFVVQFVADIIVGFIVCDWVVGSSCVFGWLSLTIEDNLNTCNTN